MNSYGKVIEYNGHIGKIKGVDGKEYLLFSDEVIDQDIVINSYVSFDSEIYKDIELEKNIARFVKKVDKS